MHINKYIYICIYAYARGFTVPAHGLDGYMSYIYIYTYVCVKIYIYMSMFVCRV